MFCSNCGNKLNPSDVFCPKCGTKVVESAHPHAQDQKQPQPPKPQRSAETPEQEALRKAIAEKNAKATRIVLICVLVAMLSCCFISCIGGLFTSDTETPSGATASSEITATTMPTTTAKPTPTKTPKPTPTPTPAPTTAADYKNICRIAEHDNVARNPSDYEGKDIKVTGEVVQVSEGWFDSVTIRLRIGDSYDEWKYWIISYTRKSDTESRVLEGDTITAYGKCNGVESYISVLGATVTTPSMDAEYIDIE